jgi:hypothetical protein
VVLRTSPRTEPAVRRPPPAACTRHAARSPSVAGTSAAVTVCSTSMSEATVADNSFSTGRGVLNGAASNWRVPWTPRLTPLTPLCTQENIYSRIAQADVVRSCGKGGRGGRGVSLGNELSVCERAEGGVEWRSVARGPGLDRRAWHATLTEHLWSWQARVAGNRV